MAMADFSRSRSYSDSRSNNTQLEVYGGRQPSSSYDLRSYSTSVYHDNHYGRELKLKKGKSSSSSWSFIKDPEFQRKKRVASYKVYSVEGKVKGSFRKSFRWLKDKYTHVVYGWW